MYGFFEVSPDGTRFAFEHATSETFKNIYTVDAHGENLLQLTDTRWDHDDPSWSPDGTQIAYVAKPEGRGAEQVFVMDVDGSNQRQLTDDELESKFHPEWSPDGTQILFEVWGGLRNGPVRGIFSVAADATTPMYRGDRVIALANPLVWQVREMKLLYTRAGMKLLYTRAGTAGDDPLSYVRSDLYVRDLASEKMVALSEMLRYNYILNTLVNADPSWTPSDW